MNTIILGLSQRDRCSLPPQGSRRSSLPATYIGTMPGFENLPAIDLYNLHVPVGVHPVGSTVSRTTLEKHGFRVPVMPPIERQGGADMSEVEARSCLVGLSVAAGFPNRGRGHVSGRAFRAGVKLTDGQRVTMDALCRLNRERKLPG